jgi:hypothetical protein
MSADRKAVEQALKKGCVPELRSAGFRGSFPHFYRATDDGFVALISFQFFSSGGSLCINLSYADPERKNIYFRPDTEPKKLRASQARVFHRLGARSEGSDCWYSFGKTSYGEFRGQPLPLADLVETVRQRFKSEAEGWWSAKRESG